MKLAYAVTFEFSMKPPVTLKGVIAASGLTTCVSRATREAKKALRPIAWTSMVVCITERLDEAE